MRFSFLSFFFGGGGRGIKALFRKNYEIATRIEPLKNFELEHNCIPRKAPAKFVNDFAVTT